MSITSVLPYGGLRDGDYFTVVNWINNRDKSYIGDIFEVTSVAANIVCTIRHTGRMMESQPVKVTLDFTQIEISALSEEQANHMIISDKYPVRHRSRPWYQEMPKTVIRYKPIKLVIANET